MTAEEDCLLADVVLMRLLRPLPSILTALLMLVAALVAFGGAWSAFTPAASAQDGAPVVVVTPVEVSIGETATATLRVEPSGGAPVGALTLTVELPAVVLPIATEPLVGGFCEIQENRVRFSGFEVAGWSTPTDLCQITLQGAATAGSGTPAISISVVADPNGARLAGTTNPGIFTVTSAAAVVAPTSTPVPEPTPEPTAEPTPEPTAEPTPEPTVEPQESEDSDTTPPGDTDPESSASAGSPNDEAAANDEAADASAGEAIDQTVAEAADVVEDDASSDTDGRGGRADADADSTESADDEDPDTSAADAPDDVGAEAQDSGDEAGGDEAGGDEAGGDEDDSDDTSEAADSGDSTEAASAPATDAASANPVPPVPAEGSNQALLVGIVTAALLAVGALLALGARSANRDTGLPG